MTEREQKTVELLITTVNEIRRENSEFRKDTEKLVSSINQKVEAKHMPINFEQDILKSAQQAIQSSIGQLMAGYGSPLMELVKSVIGENSKELRELISQAFLVAIRKEDFKKSIIDAFSHKVARTIISNNDGLFDKVSNELKQDAVFKARMALAVSNVVNECLCT